MRSAVALLLCVFTAPLAAQSSGPDSATALFHEATAALGRSDANRATRLFTELRERFPASPYTSESYFWHAMALAQQKGTKPRLDAMRLLVERALRFPTDAEQEEAIALERQLQREVGPGATTGDSASCVSESDEATLIASVAHASEDPAHSQALLASLLSRRTPCLTTLRRAAVHVLAAATRPQAVAALRLVASGDPDSTVRAAAARALAPPSTMTAASPSRVELRAGRDTLVRHIGDSAQVPLQYVSRDRKDVVTTFALGRPLHLIVLDVQPDGRLDIRMPDDIRSDVRGAAAPGGTFRISPRRLPAVAAATVDQQALDQAEQRRQLAIANCEARAMAQAMQREQRRASAQRGDTSAAARAAAREPAPPTADVIQRQCAGTRAPVTAGSAYRPSRAVDGPPAEGFQLVLASPVKLSRIELVARLGVLRAAPVANGGVLLSLARTIFADHPAPWSGVVIGW